MGLLNATFGQAGTAQTYFGGEWWLVGILLIFIFLMYFYGKGVSVEGLVLFIFSAILFITIDNLFQVGEDIIMTAVVFILIFIAFGLYKIVTR